MYDQTMTMMTTGVSASRSGAFSLFEEQVVGFSGHLISTKKLNVLKMEFKFLQDIV